MACLPYPCRLNRSTQQRLRAATVKGELVVHVLANPQVRSKTRKLTEYSPEKIEPVMVPVNVVKRLITSRGGLPDHPIRPSIKTAKGNEKLFALLTVGLLVVRASDFDIWYRSERAKGKWTSQRSKSKIGNGRPTKQTEPLRNAVLALVHDRKWSGEDRITTLHHLLVASGRSEVPSQDTLARLVDQLQRNGRSGAFSKPPHAAQADLVNVRFGAHYGLKPDTDVRKVP
jgi:hypothetical protein